MVEQVGGFARREMHEGLEVGGIEGETCGGDWGFQAIKESTFPPEAEFEIVSKLTLQHLKSRIASIKRPPRYLIPSSSVRFEDKS